MSSIKTTKDLCFEIAGILKDNSKTPLEKNNLVYDKIIRILSIE